VTVAVVLGVAAWLTLAALLLGLALARMSKLAGERAERAFAGNLRPIDPDRLHNLP